ncbi:uncharacterized protein BDV17DRAFT_288376 [Aspergillus undulatus]|uniref:uncharacterized protein n=1 Tax=Aspergillus undulatus TaxID=1810928 RepID=UPI003CCDA3B8
MPISPDRICEPGVIDAGLPVPNSTKPSWLSELSAIANLRSLWIDEADVVEARDLCYGATGRHSGHIKAMSPGVRFDQKEPFGVDDALRMMEYESPSTMAPCVSQLPDTVGQ